MNVKNVEKLQYEEDVKPLFRDKDRASMLFVFDLWSFEQVKQYSQEILRRLTAGSMPCDGAWPAKKVNIFRRWVEEGMNK